MLAMQRLVVFAVFLVIGGGLFAQRTIWTIGTARTVPVGEAEFGIFHPLQIGLSNTLEIQTSPLLTMSLAPNLTVKNRWYTDDYWLIATRHRYTMPTLLLERMTNFPKFEFMPHPDSVVWPYIFTLGNDVLATRRIGKELIITGKIGGDFAVKFDGDSDPDTKIDSLPLISHAFLYPRTAIYNKKFVWNVGVKVDGNIYRNHNFMADINFYSVGIGVDDWAIEHKAYYIYNRSIDFAMLIGYKLSYASFPLDKRFFISPVVDLVWKINAKPIVTTDLFRR